VEHSTCTYADVYIVEVACISLFIARGQGK
jgi:hypothetical protein